MKCNITKIYFFLQFMVSLARTFSFDNYLVREDRKALLIVKPI